MRDEIIKVLARATVERVGHACFGLSYAVTNVEQLADEILALVAHPAPAEARSAQVEWRPVETAPKDGREVLLTVKRRAGVPGKMLVGHYMAGGYSIEDHPAIEGGWYFWNGCMFDRAAEPTAWQHLPTPPKAEGE